MNSKFFFIGIAFIYLFLGCNSSKTFTIEIPKNYEGSIFIRFDCKKGTKLERDSRNVFISMPNSGILFVRDPYSILEIYPNILIKFQGSKEIYKLDELKNEIYDFHSGGDWVTIENKTSHEFKSHFSGLSYICFYFLKSSNTENQLDKLKNLQMNGYECESLAKIAFCNEK